MAVSPRDVGFYNTSGRQRICVEKVGARVPSMSHLLHQTQKPGSSCAKPQPGTEVHQCWVTRDHSGLVPISACKRAH